MNLYSLKYVYMHPYVDLIEISKKDLNLGTEGVARSIREKHAVLGEIRLMGDSSSVAEKLIPEELS